MKETKEPSSKHGININSISNNVIIRVLLISILFFLALKGIYIARAALVLVGVAFFLAIALNPPVSWFSKRLTKNSRGLATGVAYLIVLSFIALLLYFVVPPLVNQTESFIENAPELIEEFKTSDSPLAKFAQKYNIPEQLDQLQENLSNNLGRTTGPILNIVKTIASSVAGVITVLVLTFFMLVEGPKWLNVAMELQPVNKRKHRREMALKMYNVVTGYVNGQLFIALLGATSSYIIMRILGIGYALPLAGIVFICELIPLIGATLGGAIVAIVALFKSVPAFIIVVVYLLIYQQLENSFVQPKVQSKSTNISPLTVLVAALVGGVLAGLLGALVAIPVAACIRILAVDYIDRHGLRTFN